MGVVKLSYRGRVLDVEIDTSDRPPTLADVGNAISEALAVAYESVKLLGVSGVKGSLVPNQHPQEVAPAGLFSGAKVLLVASSTQDVVAVRSARDLPGLASWDHELRRAAQRRRHTVQDFAEPPKGDYSFERYESWQVAGLHPSPSQALKLLYRLASDAGIQAVMAAYQWRVGLLSEMPPEGKVGVSAVCILGVNINAGAEISLRLRTDDLKGFRKYDRIRETLVHELAHMVHSEHDSNFKALNSQLLKEVDQVHARLGTARRVDGAWDEPGEGPLHSELDDVLAADDVMQVTARSSGRTLRQLAASGGGPVAATAAALTPRDARAAAALAAARRAQAAATASDVVPWTPANEAARPQPAGASDTVMSDVGAPPLKLLQPQPAAPSDTAGYAEAAASREGSDSDGSAAAERRGLEHVDERTALEEEAMRRLGSTDEPQMDTTEALASVGLTTDDIGSASAGQPPLPPTPQHAPLPSAAGHLAAEAMDVEPSAVSSADQQQALWQQQLQAQQRQAEQVAAGPKQSALPASQPAAAAPGPAAPIELPPLPADAAGISGSADADDIGVQKYRLAWAALAAALKAAPYGAAGAVPALEALCAVLLNLTQHPGEAKYERVRLAGLQSRLAGAPAVAEVLRVAGFVEEEEGGALGGASAQQQRRQQQGAVLRLRRRDPGLQWLVLSAVRRALEHVQAAAGAARPVAGPGL